MGWLSSLSTVVQQYVIYTLLALILSLSITSGYLYVTKAHVEVKLATAEANLYTCKVNTTTLEDAITKSNKKIDEDAAKSLVEKKAAEAKVAAANKTAAAKYEEALKKFNNEKPAIPDNLCLSAQQANAEFLKASK